MARLVLFLLALALSGCTSSPPPQAEVKRLEGACQGRACVCGRAGWTPFSAGETLNAGWRPNGTPFCPDGYALHTTGPAPTLPR